MAQWLSFRAFAERSQVLVSDVIVFCFHLRDLRGSNFSGASWSTVYKAKKGNRKWAILTRPDCGVAWPSGWPSSPPCRVSWLLCKCSALCPGPWHRWSSNADPHWKLWCVQWWALSDCCSTMKCPDRACKQRWEKLKFETDQIKS